MGVCHPRSTTPLRAQGSFAQEAFHAWPDCRTKHSASGGQGHVANFHVYADDVTLANLTLRDAYYHLVQVHGENVADRFRLYNCRMLDSGEQFVKVSVNTGMQPKKCENGVVEYCLFQFTTMYNNTCILNGTFPWVIDYRFSDSTGVISYNLTDGNILARDGASATRTGNVSTVQAGWFVDLAGGNLHLRETAAPLINQAASLAQVTGDFDADPRPISSAPDIGADEFHYPGDISRDGYVNVGDLQVLVADWGKAI